MNKQPYFKELLAITLGALCSGSLLGMSAKMPQEQELSRWLRQNQFSIFVRELNLGHELAAKEYSQEQLVAAISICRNERPIRKTLAQYELTKKSPELSQKLLAAFGTKQQ